MQVFILIIVELVDKKYEPIYRIDILNTPKNDEIVWWGNGLDVEKTSFEGIVVNGKG